MSVTEVFVGGRVRQRWDRQRQIYEAFGANGTVIESRPLTPAELAEAATPDEPVLAVSPKALAVAQESAAVAAVNLSAALDPDVANPSTAARLAALEAVVALLIARSDA